MTDISLMTIIIAVYIAAVFAGSLAYLRIRRENEMLRKYVDDLLQELRGKKWEDDRKSDIVSRTLEDSEDES